MCNNQKSKYIYELLKKHWNCAYSIFCARFGDYYYRFTLFVVVLINCIVSTETWS